MPDFGYIRATLGRSGITAFGVHRPGRGVFPAFIVSRDL
jgi:hypothetical protein